MGALSLLCWIGGSGFLLLLVQVGIGGLEGGVFFQQFLNLFFQLSNFLRIGFAGSECFEFLPLFQVVREGKEVDNQCPY